jgi:hypothetical protein
MYMHARLTRTTLSLCALSVVVVRKLTVLASAAAVIGAPTSGASPAPGLPAPAEHSPLLSARDFEHLAARVLEEGLDEQNEAYYNSTTKAEKLTDAARLALRVVQELASYSDFDPVELATLPARVLAAAGRFGHAKSPSEEADHRAQAQALFDAEFGLAPLVEAGAPPADAPQTGVDGAAPSANGAAETAPTIESAASSLPSSSAASDRILPVSLSPLASSILAPTDVASDSSLLPSAGDALFAARVSQRQTDAIELDGEAPPAERSDDEAELDALNEEEEELVIVDAEEVDPEADLGITSEAAASPAGRKSPAKARRTKGRK